MWIKNFIQIYRKYIERTYITLRITSISFTSSLTQTPSILSYSLIFISIFPKITLSYNSKPQPLSGLPPLSLSSEFLYFLSLTNQCTLAPLFLHFYPLICSKITCVAWNISGLPFIRPSILTFPDQSDYMVNLLSCSLSGFYRAKFSLISWA